MALYTNQKGWGISKAAKILGWTVFSARKTESCCIQNTAK